MNRMPNRWLLVPVVALLALTSATTVLAVQLVVETFHEEGTAVQVVDCGTFVGLEDFVEAVRVTTFFNSAGDPVKLQVKIDYNGRITNSVTGLTLPDPEHWMVTVDLTEKDTATYVGLVLGLTLPGEGIALLQVGRVVVQGSLGNVIFEAGPHQLTGDFEADEVLVCAALD